MFLWGIFLANELDSFGLWEQVPLKEIGLSCHLSGFFFWHFGQIINLLEASLLGSGSAPPVPFVALSISLCLKAPIFVSPPLFKLSLETQQTFLWRTWWMCNFERFATWTGYRYHSYTSKNMALLTKNDLIYALFQDCKCTNCSAVGFKSHLTWTRL